MRRALIIRDSIGGLIASLIFVQTTHSQAAGKLLVKLLVQGNYHYTEISRVLPPDTH
jgi:hypothetical protein